jgi:hypothetical protein
MKFFLIEKIDTNAILDFKDNIERLRKIRKLNIKDMDKIKNLERHERDRTRIGPY